MKEKLSSIIGINKFPNDQMAGFLAVMAFISAYTNALTSAMLFLIPAVFYSYRVFKERDKHSSIIKTGLVILLIATLLLI